ncbi:MAG: hypothetical protein AAGD06_05750 [Acidobacteriota bacterium]
MRVVYLSIGMSSALNASFELSRRLTAAGHEVVYLSHADVGPRVEAQGHRFHRLDADRRHLEQAKAEAPNPRDLLRPWRLARSIGNRRRIRRRSIAEDELVETVRRLEPDLLLIDIELHVAILATAPLGIPTALPMVWFSIYRSPGLPPLHTSAKPIPGAAGKRTEWLAWTRLRLETLHMEWRRRLGRWRRGDVFPAVAYDTVDIDDVRAVARHWGFPAQRVSRRHWLRPWTYTDLPVLCFNDPALDFPHDPPPNLHYLGPMVDRRRAEAQIPGPSADAWAAFSQRRDRERPLVYASLGTYWAADTKFLGRILEVFRRRPEWDLVLGLGGRLDAASLPTAGDNVLALDFAPQLEVLGQADAALTHGGIGTINECLLLRVPMAVYSTGFVDQDGCAARLDHHGLAVVGDKDADDSHAIERALERALGDRELRGRVSAAADRLHALEASGTAVELLETLTVRR